MKGQSALMSSARDGSGSDHWCTAPDVLDMVRLISPIALDPCSNEQSTVGAPMWFTGHDIDGLKLDWNYTAYDGLVFVNPPYSALAAWVDKMVAEADRGTRIVTLIPARTDTKAWHRLMAVADVVAFWRGRMKFWVDGKPGGPAPFPSALVGINIAPSRFRAAFANKAHVVTL